MAPGTCSRCAPRTLGVQAGQNSEGAPDVHAVQTGGPRGPLSAPQQSTGMSAWSPRPRRVLTHVGLDGCVTPKRVMGQRSERPSPGCHFQPVWAQGRASRGLGHGAAGHRLTGGWGSRTRSRIRRVMLGAGEGVAYETLQRGTTPRQPWDPATGGRDRRAWVPTGGHGWPRLATGCRVPAPGLWETSSGSELISTPSGLCPKMRFR